MHKLYELKEKVCEELKSYGKKGELTASSLAMVDTLAHTLKNLDKIIEMQEKEEEKYSQRRGSRAGSFAEYDGMSSEASYARGRGRSARRDSMGRYSRDGYSEGEELIAELHELMRTAPDERTRQKVRSLITKMEEM